MSCPTPNGGVRQHSHVELQQAQADVADTSRVDIAEGRQAADPTAAVPDRHAEGAATATGHAVRAMHQSAIATGSLFPFGDVNPAWVRDISLSLLQLRIIV